VSKFSIVYVKQHPVMFGAIFLVFGLFLWMMLKPGRVGRFGFHNGNDASAERRGNRGGRPIADGAVGRQAHRLQWGSFR
jgi:hypothetical protein